MDFSPKRRGGSKNPRIGRKDSGDDIGSFKFVARAFDSEVQEEETENQS